MAGGAPQRRPGGCKKRALWCMVDCPSVFRCTSTPQNAHQIIARETHVGPSITGHSVTTANDKAFRRLLEAAKTGPVILEVAAARALRQLLANSSQRPRPSGPSGKHPPHRGGGKSRLFYLEARSLELDGVDLRWG